MASGKRVNWVCGLKYKLMRIALALSIIIITLVKIALSFKKVHKADKCFDDSRAEKPTNSDKRRVE